ncbi:hypothetical protein K470DRAFT_170367 [Piedraia hortae CBS 480.64]|uniref:Aminoglycoside phosphotransferase domain-containing protein n=1 Tax=Piedraia hortae CBS 480.64 TaxID=1314780 RepID=A0A6A7BQQ8_9PEZI|nr:hypothetical protein K470DRAFT_170367 [Piedraia hortae CBS 480.64]
MSTSNSPKSSSPSSDPGTPNSASMYGFSDEPYDTFQPKIAALLESIGHFKDIVLEHLRGGSFNHVIIARATRISTNDPIQGIFRIPRDVFNEPIDVEIEDQAAVLQMLNAQKNLNTPKLLAFDASLNNPIHFPFTFIELAPGLRLHDVYRGMSLPEKLSMVDELVKYLLAAERVTFPRHGIITAAKDSPVKGSIYDPSGLPPMQLDFRHLGEFCNLGDRSNRTNSSPESWTDTLFNMIASECNGADTSSDYDPILEIWERVREVFHQMCDSGHFSLRHEASLSTAPSILYHWDLEPRNIIVTRTDEGYRIEKIIDWDGVQAVPPVMARRPPIWLWDTTDEMWDFTIGIEMESVGSDFDGDADLLDPRRYNACKGRLSDDERLIRTRFEERLVQGLGEIYEGYNMRDYMEEAYGNGRWIRRMTRIVVNGIHSDWEEKRLEHLIENRGAFMKRSQSGAESEVSRG